MADERAEKNRAIDAAIATIEKQFGKGSIMRLGEKKVVDVPAISTSCLSLDAAIGVGGVPRGRIVEIYGPESGGKTTLALHIVAEAQKQGGVAAYIDAEHAMDAEYAKRLGVKVNDLFISQPDSGEQALEIAEALVRSGGIDVLVIDSVAALVPRAELEGEMGDSLPGLQARLMSQALRKLTAVVARSNTTLIFINQIREKIGVMFGCFHYNARVVLADGSTEKIGKIVNQRLPVEVLSYDPITEAIQPRRVVNWFNNGVADFFLQFEVEGGVSGRHTFAATPNHTIFTPHGEVAAGDLRVGDEVLAMVKDYHLTSVVSSQWSVVSSQWSVAEYGKRATDYGLRTTDCRAIPARITKIYIKPPTRGMNRFDLEVEGNHTYLVDAIVVHNSPETTSGGRALKFYSSVRLDIRRTSSIKDGDQVVGNRTRVRVVKNKVAPPFKEAEFDIMYGQGISHEGDLLDLAVTNKVVDKSGAWFSFQGERLGQGRENVKNLLKTESEIAARIEVEVRKALGLSVSETGEEPQSDGPSSQAGSSRKAASKEAD
ncbi:MAG: recombinase RecA [Blastocatellia bacterium]|nr:recombinase RecA [Blastocatellia bacterium]